MLWASGPLVYDLVLLGLMAVATFMLTSYASSAASVRPAAAYNVYDAVTTARARWLLPKKAETATSFQPGETGRWQLADADGAFDDWAALMQAVHRTSRLWTAYGVVQEIGRAHV